MKKLLLLIVVFSLSKSFAQDISGNWVSNAEKTKTLKNQTVNRIYEITINSNMDALEGKTKTSFSWKTNALGFNLFGMVDASNHLLSLRVKESKVSGIKADNLKDGNAYRWTYTVDSLNEYLILVLNEEDPHIMLDSNIVFTRPIKNKSLLPIATSASVVKPTTDSVKINSHPVTTRTNKLYKEIIADADIVKIELYDVGEIDGDSVSLFLNQQLIAQHQMLQATAITFTLKLDTGLVQNSLVLFAENLGRVPPNTAFMVITINKKEYRLNMQSDEKINGEIVFKFQGK